MNAAEISDERRGLGFERRCAIFAQLMTVKEVPQITWPCNLGPVARRLRRRRRIRAPAKKESGRERGDRERMVRNEIEWYDDARVTERGARCCSSLSLSPR